MTTTTPAGLRRPSTLGQRFLAVSTILALVGFAGSPALALSRTGVTTSPSGPVVVQDPCVPTPSIDTFTADRAIVTFGGSTRLSWNVQVPPGCSYVVALLGQSVGLQGWLDIYPVSDTTYTLTLAWGPSRTLYATKSTDPITVSLPPDPADPTRNLVTITSQDMLPMFMKALRTPNTTVITNVDLDLSGLSNIVVEAGVRLVGSRTAVPGKPYQPGPRLFTTTIPSPLLNVKGPGARITGLRIQGHLSIDPPGISGSDDDSSIGISIAFESRGPSPIEIDHNEIYGWSGAGVQVLGQQNWPFPIAMEFDDAAKLLLYGSNPEPAYIHDNYIHNNLHSGKMGYGVVMGRDGAHALIERNVFDWNRHAIAGDGADNSGYRAYRNLVLPHGGNDAWLAGVWQYTHMFDMHGQSSYCLQGFLDRDCGTAGYDIDIQYNSFLYTAGLAIKVRGTPQLLPYGALIRSNVFAHPVLVDGITSDGAVDWTEGGVWLGNDNQVGVTPSAVSACDFDGDGVNDLFLTTGQTWWYSSAGTGPWTYLNASTLSLQHGDVSLGYFDGDNLCDVSAGGVIYSDGTPQPPQRLPRPIPAKARRLLGQ
jgi:hypothetical protein